MGTISDKLVYLNDTKAAIKTAIENKGVTVSTDTTFRDYASKIGEISGGGGAAINGEVLSSGVLGEDVAANDMVYGVKEYDYENTTILTQGYQINGYIDSIPVADVTYMAKSLDGKYMALGAPATTVTTLQDDCIFKIYKFQNGRWNRISYNPSLMNIAIGSLCISSDGTYIFAGGNIVNSISVLKNTNDVYSVLTTLTTVSGNTIRNVAISPDGNYVIITGNTSPFVWVYERSGDTFTLINSPAPISMSGECYGISWSRDSQYLYISLKGSPFMAVYNVVNGVFTKLNNPTILPSGTTQTGYFPTNMTWSPDGNILGVFSNTAAPYASFYKLDKINNTLTKIANPSTLPPGSVWALAWTEDGKYAITSGASHRPMLFRRESDDSFTYITQYTTMTYNSRNGIITSRDGYMYAGLRGGTTPYAAMNIIQPAEGTIKYYKVKDNDIDNINLPREQYVIGYAKESGAAGSTINIVKLIY